MQWSAIYGNAERYRKIVQKRRSLTIRFQQVFMSQDWQLVRVDVRENADGLEMLTAHCSIPPSHAPPMGRHLSAIESARSRFDEECS